MWPTGRRPAGRRRRACTGRSSPSRCATPCPGRTCTSGGATTGSCRATTSCPTSSRSTSCSATRSRWQPAHIHPIRTTEAIVSGRGAGWAAEALAIDLAAAGLDDPRRAAGARPGRPGRRGRRAPAVGLPGLGGVRRAPDRVGAGHPGPDPHRAARGAGHDAPRRHRSGSWRADGDAPAPARPTCWPRSSARPATRAAGPPSWPSTSTAPGSSTRRRPLTSPDDRVRRALPGRRGPRGPARPRPTTARPSATCGWPPGTRPSTSRRATPTTTAAAGWPGTLVPSTESWVAADADDRAVALLALSETMVEQLYVAPGLDRARPRHATARARQGAPAGRPGPVLLPGQRSGPVGSTSTTGSWPWPSATAAATRSASRTSATRGGRRHERRRTPTEPDLRVTSADGTPIAVFRSGTAGAPPLLLVHGAAADHTTFRVLGPLLRQRSRPVRHRSARSGRVRRHAARTPSSASSRTSRPSPRPSRR